MRSLAVITLLLLPLGDAAFACESVLDGMNFATQSSAQQSDLYQSDLLAIEDAEGFQNRDWFPIARGKSCAFAFAGDFDLGFGKYSVDHSGGWISQVLEIRGCYAAEFVTIANCASGEFLIVHGDGPELEDGTVAIALDRAEIGHHLAPEGAIDLWNDVSIENLVKSANSADLDVTLPATLKEFEAAHFEGDEVRPLCGCKIYYPDSVGAKS